MLRVGLRVERKDNRMDETDPHTVPPGARGTIIKFPMPIFDKARRRMVDAAQVEWDQPFKGAKGMVRTAVTLRTELLIPLEDD